MHNEEGRRDDDDFQFLQMAQTVGDSGFAWSLLASRFFVRCPQSFFISIRKECTSIPFVLSEENHISLFYTLGIVALEV